VGRVQVPENQDVFLQLLGHAELSYLAHAHEVPKDAWQPFCHHGAGYALAVGGPMEAARDNVDRLDHMWFSGTGTDNVNGKGWALFYWRLRYRVVPDGPYGAKLQERFGFIDEPRALEE
jgi:hypothetical protein